MTRYARHTWTEDFNGRTAELTSAVRADPNSMGNILTVEALVKEDDWSPMVLVKVRAEADIVEARQEAVARLRAAHARRRSL